MKAFSVDCRSERTSGWGKIRNCCSSEPLESVLSDMTGFVVRRCESEGIVWEKREDLRKPVSRLP